MALKHAGMRVEAGVAEIGDLLGEQLDTVGRVTKDDGLVDLQLQAYEIYIYIYDGIHKN